MENLPKSNCPDKIIKKFLRTRIIVGNKISFAWRLSVLQKIVRNETDVFCLIFEDYPHAVLNFNTVFMLRTESSIFVNARIYLQNYSIHFNSKFTSLNSNHFSRWSVFWVNKCKNSQNVSMSHSLSEQRSGQSRTRLHDAFLLIRCEQVFSHKTPSVNFYPAFSFINFLLFFNILFFKEDFTKINI